MNKQEGKVKDWLKKFLSSAIVTGTVSVLAKALLASPLIALFEVLGTEAAYLFIEKLLGEDESGKLREFLGMKKYSTSDIEEIFKIAKENEEVKKILAELMNKLIDEELLKKLEKEIPGSLKAVSQAVDELKKEIPDIKERLENLETRVGKIEKELTEIKIEQKELKEAVEELIKRAQPEYVKNEDDLIKKLENIEWVKERKPVVSDRLREKIGDAIKYVKKGKKVCIIGEPGIGKTTALYLACRDLMKEGIKLRTSGIKGGGILVVDNIGAKKDLLKKLESCTTPVIASARESEWKNPGGWHEIRIEIEDQRPKLREMFKSMLNTNSVKYKEDVVDDILKRVLLPMYLYYIANDFKGRKISKKDVSKFPEDVYVYRAEAIRDSRDDLAAALLYCVAKTRTGWLCETQLDILGEILKERIPGLKGGGKYERLLAKFHRSFGIIHEIDRDLMIGKDVPEEATSIIENIGAIRRMRAYDVEKFTKEACARSLNHIGYMDLSAAVELMERALENFPDLTKEARKMAEKDKRLLPYLARILNNLGFALYSKGMTDEAIDKLEDVLKIYRDLAERDEKFLPDLAMTLGILELALYDKGMTDNAIEKLEDVLKIYRDLAERDEKFLPDLARILNNLGDALYKKGLLDEAIEKYDEALKAMEPLSDRPLLWDIISESHIRIALSLLERDKKGATEHLCAALKMLTDERAPKTYYSEKLLEDCISHLKKIPKDLIPEECREKLGKMM